MAVKSYLTAHSDLAWRCTVCFEFDFLAVVDGGSLDHGTATNNEAEYRTLIAALKDLTGRIQKAGRSPASYSLLVYTDSQLMVGQITQGWQVKAANLRPLIDEARSLLKAFGKADLVKVPRDEIVRVLGH